MRWNQACVLSAVQQQQQQPHVIRTFDLQLADKIVTIELF